MEDLMDKKKQIEVFKMTESKFTPGPWMIDGGTCDHHILAKRKGKLCNVAEAVYDESNEPSIVEIDANERLIEAAPAMFKSLNRLIPWIGRMIADGAHKNTVAPLDCENGLAEAEALIKKILGD
jgi:hypothetical protein